MPHHGATADQRRVDGHKQSMHMENGQGVQQHIAGGKAPVVVQTLGAALQIGVAEHGAFAAPRGAAGVQNRRQIVGAPHGWYVLIAVVGSALQQAAPALIVQGHHIAAALLKSQLADPAEVGGGTHHHRGFGVAYEIFQLSALVSRVEWQKHMARSQGGKVQHQRLYRLVHLNGDA